MGRLNKKTNRNPHTANHEPPDSFNLPEVSARRYQDLFNNASDAIFIRDLKGNIIEVNEAAATLTGYTHNELTGMNVSEFLIAESFKLIMKKQKALLKDEAANQRYELEIISKDGVRLSAESRTSLLTHNGRSLGVQCIVRDITERKQMEEERNKLLRTIEIAREAINITSPDGTIIYTNQAMDELFGYERGELIGKYPSVLNAGPAPEAVTKNVIDTMEKEGFWEGEIHNVRKDGTEFSSYARISALVGKDGSIANFLSTQHDISECKRAEEALQASEERFRNIYEESPIGIELYDCDGRLLTANRACLDIFGVSNIAEVRGFKLLEDPNVTAEVKQRLHKMETVRYEAPFDFEKVKKHKLYNTSKSGTIHLNVLITPLSVRGENLSGGYLVQVQDITQRKQVEEELRIAEQNFRNSLDSSPLGIRIVTAEGELLYANQAILDIYGYSSVEELKSVPTKQRYTPESYAEHRERAKKRKLGKPVPSNYEVSIVRKDGEVRHLAVFRKAVIWGGEIQFQALYQDITERKLIEEALRLQSEIVANMAEGVVVTRASDGVIIYTNQKFEKMFGYGEGELLGKYVSMLNAPGDKSPRERVEEIIKSLSETGVWYGEVYNIKKDGTPFWCQASVSTLEHAQLGMVWVATHEDITERKRVEMALQRSEEFNSSLLNNSPNPILVLNADASIKYVNPALEKLTGFSSAELIGSKPPYPWWIEETHKELSRRLVQAMRRGTRKCEFLFRKKNGERFWVEKIFKTVRVNGEFKHHLVNWVDLTEQKRLKANMEFYLSEITRAQEEERRRIAREIHDDSIQSLATLALGIDAITREKERLPKDITQRLKGLRAETDSILDGLRRFSHELRPGVIDQVGLVPALEILTEELNKGNRVKASLEVAGSERRLIPETEVALFRIAQEALRNIKKHSRATRAAMKLKFTGGRIKLTVSDDGRGFELPGTLSDFATEGKLGLIGMQERTRLLDGKLLVKSRVGRGTTVVVEVADIG